MKNQIAIGLSITLMSTCVMAQALFQDGFESGDKQHTENGFTWNATSRQVNTLNPRTGQYSLEFLFREGSDGEDSSAEQRFALGGNYPEIWIKYDLYVPENYYHRSQSGSSANNKGIVTLWSGDYSGSGRGQFLGFEHWPTGDGSSRLSFHPIIGASDDRGHTFPGTLFIDRSKDLGKWIEFIVHFKVASSANNDGIIRAWKTTEGYPRETLVDVSNYNNYTPSGNYFNTGYLLGWSNSGFSETTKIYIDNFVFSQNPIGMKQPSPPSTLQIEK